MGTVFYPDLLNSKAICPQHFPKQWQFFLLPFLVSNQTPNNCRGEHLSSVRPGPGSCHAVSVSLHDILPVLQSKQNCCWCCTALHLAPRPAPILHSLFWKAITCYSRAEMAITLGAHSSNKRVSHLLPQNLCFPCCLHSKFSIWVNDQGELITSPSKQFHCARNKIYYHPSYILILKFLMTLSSWSSLFFSSQTLPCLYLLSFQFICSKPSTLLGIPWYHIMENLEIKVV